MTVFIIDFGSITVRIAKHTMEEAIEFAREKYPHRIIVDIYIQ